MDELQRGGVGKGFRRRADWELIEALRGGDEAAGREYYRRFAPRLRRLATRMGMPHLDMEELVDELLADVLLAVTDRMQQQPRNLAVYLNAALRRRVLNWQRGRERRAQYESEEEEVDADALTGPEGGLFCSDATVRASTGPDYEEPALPFALRKLISALDESLADEERVILAWVSNCVLYEDIARWTGKSYEATGRRIRRLADRLLEAAEAYANGLTDEDWRELEPFFRRAAGSDNGRGGDFQTRVNASRAAGKLASGG